MNQQDEKRPMREKHKKLREVVGKGRIKNMHVFENGHRKDNVC